jgi:predicted ArsR family transcriptional regulator
MNAEKGGRNAPTTQERIITLDGRRVLTAAQVAARLGISPDSVRKALQRGAVTADDHIDERTPVYYPETIEAYAAGRPGRGTRTDLRHGSAPIADTNKGGPTPK